MENRINKLEEKLKQADALRTKTPSPAVWGRIASQLDQSEIQPVRTIVPVKWYRMVATIALILGFSTVLIYTIDRQTQNDSWTACNDCVESLDEQPFLSSLPISVSARSLYQPFTRSAQGNGIYAGTERLSAAATPKAVNIERIMAISSALQNENTSAILGSWKSPGAQKHWFSDKITASETGLITWQRIDSNGLLMFSGRSLEPANEVFEMQIRYGDIEFKTNAFFKYGCLIIDLTEVNGRFYRWFAKPDESALFTSIFPMNSYTALPSGEAERYGEQNVVLSK